MLRGDRCAVLVGELLSVDLYSEAMVCRGLEQAADLIRGEGDPLAKGVDAGRQFRFRDLRDQLVDDLAHVMRAAVALVSGKRVQRKQGRNDANRLAFAEAVGDLKQADFAL